MFDRVSTVVFAVPRMLSRIGVGRDSSAPAVITYYQHSDIERADEIAESMALSGRKLNVRAYDELLDSIVAERLKNDM